MAVVRRWRSEVWIIAAVLIFVAGLDAAVKVSAAMNPVQLVPAWKLRADVMPGQALDNSLVDRVDVKAGQPVLGDIRQGYIFSHGMHADDVLRPDDVARASTVTTVPLDFKIAPDLVAGEYIDVYGLVPTTNTTAPGTSGDGSSALKLLGHHLAVVSVGSHVVVDVPTRTADAWAYAIEGREQLVAFISAAGNGTCSQAGPLTLDQALQELNAAAASGDGGSLPLPSGCAGGG
jgi:hypothetical protein